MIKVKLTSDAGEVHKKSSVILSGIFALITAFGPEIIAAWNLLPDSLRNALPDGMARWVATIAFLLIIASRYTHIKREPS